MTLTDDDSLETDPLKTFSDKLIEADRSSLSEADQVVDDEELSLLGMLDAELRKARIINKNGDRLCSDMLGHDGQLKDMGLLEDGNYELPVRKKIGSGKRPLDIKR